jgi:CRP-like cAMP-binding protein
MDLLERARCLMACPLFESLAPAVLIRLAERAHADELARGERRRAADTVWVVARGEVSVGTERASAGHAIGVIRIVRPDAPAAELVASEPSVVVGLAADDVRDILEEDPAALAAIADRIAALLLDDAP